MSSKFIGHAEEEPRAAQPAPSAAPATERQEILLRGGHLMEIASRDDGATLRVRAADHRGAGPGAVEIELGWSDAGPVVRVRAARIDVDTTADINVRCKSFQVQASEGIHLRAGGVLESSAEAVELEARTGRIVARANDDVQLLGEEVLLNCDRTPPIPAWAAQAPGLMMGELLDISDASGDPELVAAVRDEPSKEHAPR